ncbi:MAG: hypothetical protein IT423_20615 [Pirellulaceae bacterium]|nr:hypothetical protein [Pirellulaceae bacterium]
MLVRPLIAFQLGILLCLGVSGGCMQVRSSTHELEHETPAHWPTSLADAAEKLEQRINSISTNDPALNPARTELKDIITWLPEVAADTYLKEDQWMKIHAACQRTLATDKPGNESSVRQEVVDLCALLRSLQASSTTSPWNVPTEEHE